MKQYNLASTRISCSLCQHKTFKNERGLRIHWQRTHQSKNTQNFASTNSRIFCVLCPRKSYKNQKGLNHHEAIVHSHYNTPQAELISQPSEAISEFRSILVYIIQTKLKTSAKEAGQQIITIPYLESQFVGVFNSFINRYSPSRRWYNCIFSGIGAYECLSQIFGDEKWGVREYKNKQQTWVILNRSEECLEHYNKRESLSQPKLEI
ncbi:hypothetical protein F8M41_009501 [Gigaspora margarita]|uniref:C2H2-type domain-containing protein n=1 Tax=Gigaspora margarita TaxID=4874 RepID=A0A8H4A1M7_GIGMA|nr:hypothetical protein F8M41_009501 [Gigaspora margarita]